MLKNDFVSEFEFFADDELGIKSETYIFLYLEKEFQVSKVIHLRNSEYY